MTNQTKEELWIQMKLKEIGIDFDKLSETLKDKEMIKYISKKGYDDTNYKIYRWIDAKEIEIYLTPTTRLDDVNTKYKLAKPLICYIKSDNEENIEEYMQFLNMLKEINTEKLQQIEEEQEQYKKKIPYQVKYLDNFMWDIYYSEIEDKYFMMFPIKETQVETLFYIIKQKLKNTNKKEMIYVPINQEDYDYKILKKSEVADLENYLWFFTNHWPTTYEVQNEEKNRRLEIIGTTNVYEKIQSKYKFILKDKNEAQEQFKLIKALFILQSHLEQIYKFKTQIDDNGSIEFCYNRMKITYKNLPQFIETEIEKNKEKIKELQNKNIAELEKLLLLQESVEKQKEEYEKKEKQIAIFLECKKSFFGRVNYYFKTKKKKKDINNNPQDKKPKEQKIETSNINIEEKNFYTIEDLVKICDILVKIEKEYKEKLMDVQALEDKKEKLERKIKNATLYINEIESHKKSIFEFWKYTNKDEVSLLQEGEKSQEDKKTKIKRVFSYDEDIEEFGEQIDNKQRNILTNKEINSIYAIYNELQSFNILKKDKITKKDEKQLEDNLNKLKEQYKKDFEKIKQKDFDIFGGMVEDKTKIKILNNKKHRETEKDIYNILNIHLDTTLEEYKDIIKQYLIILEESYKKIKSPYNLSVYQFKNTDISESNFEIFNLNPKDVIEKADTKCEKLILNKINIKANMPLIFYTNSIFYNNRNETLPLGMNLGTEVLIDLDKYEKKLISRKDFKKNFMEDEFNNCVKTIELYEYELNREEKK